MEGKWDSEIAEQEIEDYNMEQLEMQADMLEEIGDDFQPDGDDTMSDGDGIPFLCYATKQPWHYELRDWITRTQRRRY